jgi:hypothetical protein
MRAARIFSLKSLAVLVFPFLLAAVGYAAAAANTVPQTRGGDGGGSVTNYTLDTATPPNTTTSLHVSLETNGDPTKILKVRFTVTVGGGAAAPQSVRAAFLTGGGSQIGSWYSTCTNLSGTTWECTPSGAPAYVQNGIQLRVVAAQ